MSAEVELLAAVDDAFTRIASGLPRWPDTHGDCPPGDATARPMLSASATTGPHRSLRGALHCPEPLVTSLRSCLAEPAHDPTNVEVLERRLGDHHAARTVVCVGLLEPGWLVEIEAVAAG